MLAYLTFIIWAPKINTQLIKCTLHGLPKLNKHFCLVTKSNVHYRFHKTSSLDHVVGYFNAVGIFIIYFSQMNYKIILPYMLMSQTASFRDANTNVLVFLF